MANYYEHARSNYFEVKDEEAFLAWAKKRDVNTNNRKGSPLFAIFANDEDGWPSWDFELEDEDGESVEIDFVQELAGHLKEGQVAVLQSVGYENLRYLNAWATAFDHTGRQIAVSIEDIYATAAAAFHVKLDQVERCEY